MTEDQCLILAGNAVEKAKTAGADCAEAYVTSSRQLSIEVRNQGVETLKMADEAGIGIRVIKGGRVGFAFSSDISAGELTEIVEQAMANSIQAAYDEFNALPDASGEYVSIDLYDPEIETSPVEQKIEIARDIERSGKAYDSRVRITESCTYQDSIYSIAVANTSGLGASYQASVAGAYSQFVAEENGDFQTGFGLQFSLKLNELNPKQIGEEGAEKAVRMLGAGEIATQKMTLVLDPYTATNFLDIIAPAVTGDAVQKGKSLFAGKLEQRVMSDLVTIIDDGTKRNGIASAPFDGEGVATSKNIVVENGILKGFLYDTYTAAKDGCKSTGNGTRSGSFKGTPGVGTTNFYVQKGGVTRQKLLEDISKGIYVTQVLGMHTANPISGDFSIGVAGILIEDGEFTTPVRGIAVAGNMLELFSSIDCVADDLRFFVDKGSPTIRIPSITVSGS